MHVAMIVVSLLVLIAAFLAMITARALWEAPDALTRLNLITPLTGVALPLLIIAHLIHDAAVHRLNAFALIEALLAIAFLLAVASVAGFALARTLYGTVVDDRLRACQRRSAENSRKESE